MTNDTQKMIEALRTQLAQIEAELARQPKAANADAEIRIMKALHERGGHATVAELCADTGITKGTLWRHIKRLDLSARVWLRTTGQGREDGRTHTVVYDADAIAC